MDHLSRDPQLEGPGGASALIPGDGCFPCSLVGNGILSDRLDVRTGFSAAAISRISERRLCGTAGCASFFTHCRCPAHQGSALINSRGALFVLSRFAQWPIEQVDPDFATARKI